MLTEQYVSFDVAKLLKEKGFDAYCKFVWYSRCPFSLDEERVNKHVLSYFYATEESENEISYSNKDDVPEYIYGDVYAAPTHQLARKWLREEKDINITIEYLFGDIDVSEEPYYSAWIVYKTKDKKYAFKSIDADGDESYEEVEEKAMKWVLENLV